MNDSFEQMLFIPSTLTLSNGVMLNQSGEIDFGAGNRSRNLFLEIQQNNNISFKPEILFFQSQNKDYVMNIDPNRNLTKQQPDTEKRSLMSLNQTRKTEFTIIGGQQRSPSVRLSRC